jgi:hypothetical protein
MTHTATFEPPQALLIIYDVQATYECQIDVRDRAPYNAAQGRVSEGEATMKLLVFVTEYSVADPTVDALVEQGFRVTRLASTGGFLRKGNTTLLVGVEDSAVDRAIAIAHRTAPGALVITLDLERYERI